MLARVIFHYYMLSTLSVEKNSFKITILEYSYDPLIWHEDIFLAFVRIASQYGRTH